MFLSTPSHSFKEVVVGGNTVAGVEVPQNIRGIALKSVKSQSPQAPVQFTARKKLHNTARVLVTPPCTYISIHKWATSLTYFYKAYAKGHCTAVVLWLRGPPCTSL